MVSEAMAEEKARAASWFGELRDRIVTAVETLEQSIRNGWQGLFPPKDAKTPTTTIPESTRVGEIRVAGRSGFVIDGSQIPPDLDFDEERDRIDAQGPALGVMAAPVGSMAMPVNGNV